MVYFWLVVICLIIWFVGGGLISYFLSPRGKLTKVKVEKEDMIYYIIDGIIYKIACILTLGLIYLIRVIITEGISVALSRRAWLSRNREFLKKIDKKLLDE